VTRSALCPQLRPRTGHPSRPTALGGATGRLSTVGRHRPLRIKSSGIQNR